MLVAEVFINISHNNPLNVKRQIYFRMVYSVW